MAAEAAAAIAQGLRLHDDVRRSTQLPCFFGFDKENTVSANTLVDRVEAAAAIAGWDDARKCREFFLVLRREASLWWESLRHLDFNRNTEWARVKERFLKSYAARFTARTNCLNLLKLSQAPGERVQMYFLRLDETFKRMNENRPAEAFDVREPALAAAQNKDRDARIKLEGLKDQEKFFLTQMFIAGLRENLRQKVMEDGAADLIDLVDLAMEKETIFLNENKPETLPIFSIEEKEEKPEKEEGKDFDLNFEEIEMINAIRKSKNLPPFRKSGSGGFTGTCRYCKITGHSQKYCRKRIKDKAPLVDQNGTPFSNHSKVNSVQEQPFNYWERENQDFQRISALGDNHLNY